MMNKVTFVMATFALMIALMRQPLVPTVSAQLPGTSITTGSNAPGATCGATSINTPGSIYIQASNGHVWTCVGSAWVDDTAFGVPSGLTAMVTSGSCPTGYTEVTALDAGMPEGTLNAHGDVGGTGGANTITPTVATLTAAAQTFTGSALGTHTHTLTATGSNGTSSVTGTLNSFDNRPAYVKVIYCQKS